MTLTRRDFVIGTFDALAVMGLVAATPRDTEAYLLGTWWLACPYSDCDRIDQVTQGTKQHVCSKCRRQMFSGSRVTIACPVHYHLNPDVDTFGNAKAMTSYACRTCKMECRVPEPPARREPRDRGGRP
jgi:hypothetical protein